MGINFVTLVTLIHILSAVIAVGATTVTDYLHLVGLRKKVLEKQLKNVYPHLSNLINFSLVLIVLSGIFLVINDPLLLSSSLFRTKVCLIILIILNGIYLQKKVAPHLDLCVSKGRKYCSLDVLFSSAISGSISIVTWYAVIILSLTKKLGYTVWQFISAYLLVLLIAIFVALYFERKARKWNK